MKSIKTWIRSDIILKGVLVVFFACWLQACSSSDDDTSETDNNPEKETPDETQNPDENPDENPDGDPDENPGDVIVDLPIPLDPYPSNTVELTVDNAINVSSAVFRVQRAMSSLLILAADLEPISVSVEPALSAPFSLGNDFCDSGDGVVQPIANAMAGASDVMQVSLNDCRYKNATTSGVVNLESVNTESGIWIVAQLNEVEVSIDSAPNAGGIDTVQIDSARMRFQTDRSEDPNSSIDVVGESAELVIGGFALEIAPFEITFTVDETDQQTVVESTMALTSELFGGIVSSKPSAALVLSNDGLALSGGNTLRGMGSPVIEWFAGTSVNLSEELDDQDTDVVADVRSGPDRTLIGNSWEDFLTAF